MSCPHIKVRIHATQLHTMLHQSQCVCSVVCVGAPERTTDKPTPSAPCTCIILLNAQCMYSCHSAFSLKLCTHFHVTKAFNYYSISAHIKIH